MSGNAARRTITLADCRQLKPRGPAIPVTYAKEKAPREYRREGRQPVFVHWGSDAVQLASCGTLLEKLSAKAERRLLATWRRDKGAK